MKFVKKIGAALYKGEMCAKVLCSYWELCNKFGTALHMVKFVIKIFVQPCTTLKLVKFVYFDPSLPSWTHLCHLWLAYLPSLVSLPIFAYLCHLDRPVIMKSRSEPRTNMKYLDQSVQAETKIKFRLHLCRRRNIPVKASYLCTWWGILNQWTGEKLVKVLYSFTGEIPFQIY